MGFLLISIIVAIASAVSAYVAFGSILLAFIAYSAAGTLTLFSALIADGLVHRDSES
ncbi:MAG: hypothetical protein LJE62_03930 [Silicimonas sp.]|jgi:hypothetical protein|nr:hypothetical protein [Silicimonas sp.]